MKKALVVVGLLIISSATFARGKYELDITWGLGIGAKEMSGSAYGVDVKVKDTELLSSLKITNYSYFLYNDMFGVYASIGLGAVGGRFSEETKVSNITVDTKPLSALLSSFEFLVGPAFGVDIGESARFNLGVGFHYLNLTNGGLLGSFLYEFSSYRETLHSFGLGLAPQFRIGKGKVGFVIGCDLTFDFGMISDREQLAVRGLNILNPSQYLKNYFRFGATPHLGLGINL